MTCGILTRKCPDYTRMKHRVPDRVTSKLTTATELVRHSGAGGGSVKPDRSKMTAQDVALKTAGSSACAAAIAAHLDAERAKGDDFLRELLKEQDTISLSKSKSKKKKRAKGAGGVPGGGKDMCEKRRVVDLLGVA